MACRTALTSTVPAWLTACAPGDIAGTYSAIGAGAAVAGGAGGVALQNARGVILELHGVKVGVELSAAVGGVTITTN